MGAVSGVLVGRPVVAGRFLQEWGQFRLDRPADHAGDPAADVGVHRGRVASVQPGVRDGHDLAAALQRGPAEGMAGWQGHDPGGLVVVQLRQVVRHDRLDVLALGELGDG
jgi:hypothetical protein